MYDVIACSDTCPTSYSTSTTCWYNRSFCLYSKFPSREFWAGNQKYRAHQHVLNYYYSLFKNYRAHLYVLHNDSLKYYWYINVVSQKWDEMAWMKSFFLKVFFFCSFLRSIHNIKHTGNVISNINANRKRNIRLNKPRRQLTKMSGKQAIAALESIDVNTENSTTDGTVLSPNALRRKNRGKSEIETLARTIDDRRKNRMTVTFWERKKFLDICLQISKKEGKSFSRFSKQGLVRLVEELRERVANQPKASRFYDKLLHLIGYWEADKRYVKHSVMCHFSCCESG